METRILDLIPGKVKPVVNVSQYDVGRSFKFLLYADDAEYVIPQDAQVRVEGTKKDKTGFSYFCQFSENEVTVVTTAQMTVFEGETECELRILENENNIGSLNFILKVEKAALTNDVDISDTEIPAIIELATEQMEAAAASAAASKDSAEDAEAWAIGEINGTPVESTDPRYQNNSEYYAGEAKESADAAEESENNSAASAAASKDSAEDAEAWAIGEINGTPVESTDPRYQNNSEYYANEAENFADAAEESKINAAESEANAKISENILAYYANFVIPRFLIQNNRLYVSNAANAEFITANNRLYIKNPV